MSYRLVPGSRPISLTSTDTPVDCGGRDDAHANHTSTRLDDRRHCPRARAGVRPQGGRARPGATARRREDTRAAVACGKRARATAGLGALAGIPSRGRPHPPGSRALVRVAIGHGKEVRRRAFARARRRLSGPGRSDRARRQGDQVGRGRRNELDARCDRSSRGRAQGRRRRLCHDELRRPDLETPADRQRRQRDPGSGAAHRHHQERQFPVRRAVRSRRDDGRRRSGFPRHVRIDLFRPDDTGAGRRRGIERIPAAAGDRKGVVLHRVAAGRVAANANGSARRHGRASRHGSAHRALRCCGRRTRRKHRTTPSTTCCPRIAPA